MKIWIFIWNIVLLTHIIIDIWSLYFRILNYILILYTTNIIRFDYEFIRTVFCYELSYIFFSLLLQTVETAQNHGWSIKFHTTKLSDILAGTVIKTLLLRGIYSISKVENPKLFTLNKYSELRWYVNRKRACNYMHDYVIRLV